MKLFRQFLILISSRRKIFIRAIFLSVSLINLNKAQSQIVPAGNRPFEEYFRRGQLMEGLEHNSYSFTLRPMVNFSINDSIKQNFNLTPLYTTTEFNSNRPYSWGNGLMIPNTGLQQYISFGLVFTSKFFEIQFQPEFVLAENKSYFGFPDTFDERITRARFHFWNYSDVPERFGEGSISKFSFGQSKAVLKFKKIEMGLASQNIWWGPGQWNALTFSSNSRGFPHLTLNTRESLNTFLGNIEGQILIGRLENSGMFPSQFDDLNLRFFRRFNGDWRYLNAMMISFNPKWIPGLFFGINRTYQQYNEMRGNSFREFFPIFDPFQKTEFGFDRDSEGRDQQATVFARLLIPNAKAELYFEYGRRDHAFNWREAILNPEHARAYIIGFKKIIELKEHNKLLQVRGESTHQQESVNRFIRYEGLAGRYSWHMHQLARGFVNYGEQLGVGIGPGSNVQTFEVSLVDKFDKIGVLFERLENHQDFYYRAFGQQKEHQPWIDLSLGFLFNKQWNNLILSSRLQLINGSNYQWQLHPDSTPQFPRGQNLFSIHSQVSLIYLFQKSKD
ncbi:capsule assembly Wzi family protein [Cecembia lonarensis]|uniref:Capsule assembly protein Wzi n=1 Tax=Cecembia lonarensis (strain CCUG 58316 / KCTC 22772 / LW9) TaxID=1225176 RepID=K1L0P3_CECL9|nr:capsule assembly Wzi family protein [Cecembia lonarensis]EKB48336.1 hypothetical protein B879_03067 [Cecembia lonarensis LW9]